MLVDPTKKDRLPFNRIVVDLCLQRSTTTGDTFDYIKDLVLCDQIEYNIRDLWLRQIRKEFSPNANRNRY